MSNKKIHERLSTQQILDLFTYFNSDQLRAEQAKLTTAANQLKKLSEGRLTSLLELNEIEQIRQVSELIKSLNYRVEHAKEVKKREEKNKELRRKDALHRIRTQVKTLFPQPEFSPENTLELTLLAQDLHDEKIHRNFYNRREVDEQIQRSFDRHLKAKSLPTYLENLHKEICESLRDMLYGCEPIHGYTSEGEAEKILQGFQRAREKTRKDLKSPRDRKSPLIDHILNQLAIESAGNVARLPAKRPRPANQRK